MQRLCWLFLACLQKILYRKSVVLRRGEEQILRQPGTCWQQGRVQKTADGLRSDMMQTATGRESHDRDDPASLPGRNIRFICLSNLEDRPPAKARKRWARKVRAPVASARRPDGRALRAI